jgi:hypothetical protein
MENESCYEENKNLKPKIDRRKIIIMFPWIYHYLRIYNEDVKKFDITVYQGRFRQTSAEIEFLHQIFRGHVILNQSQDAMWYFLTKFN